MIHYIKRYVYRLIKSTRVRTVRHTFSITSIAVLSLVAAVLLTQDASYIRLDTPQDAVATGDRFSIDVYAGAHVSVNAIDVSVQFPADQVVVTGIDTGESVISLWTQDPYVDGNRVVLRGGTFRRGFVGEHLIARINFAAKQNGRAEFSIANTTLLAGDGSGNTVKTIDNTPVLTVAVGEEGVLDADVAINFKTDIDGDGNVSLNDVQVFVGAWRAGRWVYDFNNDKKMDFTDFAIILAHTFMR